MLAKFREDTGVNTSIASAPHGHRVKNRPKKCPHHFFVVDFQQVNVVIKVCYMHRNVAFSVYFVM